jgi:hypothetical protein
MPWFPEFAYVLDLATRRTRPADDSAVATYSSRPTAHEPGIILGATEEVTLNDPQVGHIEGHEALAEFGRESARWLAERKARTEWVASTVTTERAVGEFVVHLTEQGSKIALPIAVAVQRPPVADRPDRIDFRVYYTEWPLKGHHTVRPPILPDTGVQPQGWPGRYHAALTAGDADAITHAFEPDGYFREPSGGRYTYAGEEGLRQLFGLFFSAGGGILLEHATVTDDGVRCALEYNATRWGAHDLPPQAGIAVYERGPSGRLIAARVYDDVEPPELAAT